MKWTAGDPLGYVVAGGNGYGAGFNQFGTCYSLFVDSSFNIYISDNSFHRVTFWSVSNTTSGILVRLIVILNRNIYSDLLKFRRLVEMVLEVHQIN
jgi:hypothetical protein